MSAAKSAEQVLTELGITEPEHIDMEAIAFHLGAVVKYRPLDGCAARIIGYKNKAIISVDPYCNDGRKRFSIGHEIGHWMHDRGKGVHLCENSAISDSNGQSVSSPSERHANSYASDLILPQSMLKSRLKKREMTLKTVKDIADEFQTSMTAAAIKSVKTTKYPAMLVAFKKSGGRWFIRGNTIPDEIWPVQELHHDTGAFELLYGNNSNGQSYGPSSTGAELWINHRDSYRYRLIEHSMKVQEDMVISMLWWKDESQICDLI